MSTFDYKAHVIIMKDLIELMSISACIAVFADLIWLGLEVTQYGFTPGKFVVGIGLTLALIIAVYATVCYHIKQYKQYKLQENIQLFKGLVKSK